MKYLLFPFLLGLPFLLTAQYTEEEQAAIKSIKQFFDGMRAGDSSIISATLHPTVRFQTVFTDRNGQAQIRMGDAQRFLAQIASPHDEVYDEKIWTYEVKIDGNLASIWTEYSFFLGETFSHCGVNAFHLFKSADGWKITQITDTRRKEKCRLE